MHLQQATRKYEYQIFTCTWYKCVPINAKIKYGNNNQMEMKKCHKVYETYGQKVLTKNLEPKGPKEKKHVSSCS